MAREWEGRRGVRQFDKAVRHRVEKAKKEQIGNKLNEKGGLGKKKEILQRTGTLSRKKWLNQSRVRGHG